MSTALVLGAQLDPPPGPISSANTLRGGHSMPAPPPSTSSSASPSMPSSSSAHGPATSVPAYSNGSYASSAYSNASYSNASYSTSSYSNSSYVQQQQQQHQQPSQLSQPSHSHAHAHSIGNVPVSTPTSTYHSHGGYIPAITSQAPLHPGLQTPGLSTGVSGMGISPSTGMGVPVYSHLPMNNHRHRVTTTLWEDESTMCFQVDAKGVCVARRSDNNMINGTKLLNVCGMTRGKRDGILKNEKERIVVKVGAMHLKGVWISFERAKALAEQNDIVDILFPLFEHNLQDFLYQPEYPRTNLVMSGSQERSAQRPRTMGPMSGVPSSTSMSPPLSVPSTMGPSSAVTTTLSMAPYSAPISSYPGMSNVTHPPLMRSQTTPAFAVPLPRQSPVVTSSPNATWGQPPSNTYHAAQNGYHSPSQNGYQSPYQSPSIPQVSSFHYPNQYGTAQNGSSSGSLAGHGQGQGRDDDSFQGGSNGSLQRPAGIDRRHTDPLGGPGFNDGPGQHPESSYYSSWSGSSSSGRLPPTLPSTASSSSSGRGASGSVSSVNGPPAHVRRTSGLKRSHDASD